MTIADLLLVAHIAAGFTALSAALVATTSKTLDVAHRWHVLSGRVFFWAMVAVFFTAVPLSILRPNTFLLLVAILSFYFALAGWRYATNRRGSPRAVDWASAGLMVLAGATMIGYGALLLGRGNGNGITMLVFGGIGTALSVADVRALRRGGARGPERIAQHLTMMLAGTIATVTAFVVTNVPMKPALVLWLAPTAVITPLIVVWNNRLRQGGRRVKGMPEA